MLRENQESVIASSRDIKIENGHLTPPKTSKVQRYTTIDSDDEDIQCNQSAPAITFAPDRSDKILSNSSRNKSSKQPCQINDGKPKSKNIVPARQQKTTQFTQRVNVNHFGETPLLSKMDLNRVLVHSKCVIQPLKHIGEACFTEEVHNALKKCNLQEIYASQAFSWYVKRNNFYFHLN